MTSLEEQINKITTLISKLTEEKNVHKLLKTQDKIKNEITLASNTLNKLRKMSADEDSNDEESDNSNDEESDNSNDEESDNSNDEESDNSNDESTSADSQKKFSTLYSTVNKKMDTFKNTKITIEQKIKLKKQLENEIKVLIKILKNKKMTIIQKK